MNDNQKRFHWLLNVHLRSVFKTIFLDVNEKATKCSIGFIAILMIMTVAQIGYAYTYSNAKQLSISPIFSMGVFLGAMQVSEPKKEPHSRFYQHFQDFFLIELIFSLLSNTSAQMTYSSCSKLFNLLRRSMRGQAIIKYALNI